MAAHMASQHDQLNPLARHLVDSKQGFICPVCLQKFTADATIASHWASHVEKESAHFACKLCALEFSNVKALTAHLSSSRHREMKVKMQSIFVCCDCHAVFATRDSYAMHMMVRAQNETCKSSSAPPNFIEQLISAAKPLPIGQLNLNLPLPTSNATLSDTLALQMLAKIQADEKQNHVCPHCKTVSFSSIDSLAMHVMLKHPKDGGMVDKTEHIGLKRRISFPMEEERKKIRNSRSVSPTFLRSEIHLRCQTCSDEFDSNLALFEHVRSFHLNVNKSPIRCDVCDLDLSTKFALKVHEESDEHKMKEKNEEPRKRKRKSAPTPRSAFSGTETPISTNSESNVESVERKDEEEDVLEFLLSNSKNVTMCKFCKVVFIDRTLYQLHMGLHNVNNPWQCNLCGKVSNDVHDFSSHVITSLHY
ncbi:DgyrCDS1889 [Dimorphilus gyrociliatus]|nr:DgyrCDS1889 [Dimorphilus gyrociliatus]